MRVRGLGGVAGQAEKSSAQEELRNGGNERKAEKKKEKKGLASVGRAPGLIQSLQFPRPPPPPCLFSF